MDSLITQRRHARRYREIVRVLASHGLSGLTSSFDIRARIRRAIVGGLAAEADETVIRGRSIRALHVRRALEDLGPTFIKLGQILSTRPDLLPDVYISELKRLQDNVPPASWEAIRLLIEVELGDCIESLFASIDPEPLAAASIGQVHAGVLHDGRQVVIKVQRPGIQPIIEEDLSILSDIVRVASNRVGMVQRADAVGFVAEFSWTLRAELDFVREGRNADVLHRGLAKLSGIRVPDVIWERSSPRVLTLERLDGVRIDHVDELRAAGHDPGQFVYRIVNSLAAQIFRLGVYHADPHPGNFVVCEDGSIALLDFGQVGTIDDRLRERLLMLALACAERDPARIVDEMSMLGAVPAGWDRRAMERDIGHLIARYVGVPLRQIPIIDAIDDVMLMIRKHGLRLPAELALMAKTLSMTEALARQLDPDVNVIDIVEPTIRQSVRHLYSPSFWADRLKARPLEVMMLGAAFPGHIQRLLSRIDRNDLTFHIHYDELPETIRAMNSMVNRLAIAIVTAAAGLTWAILFLALQPSWTSLEGALFVLGFIMLVMLGMNLIARIWRNGR
jgi:ubiquinone biosynthesis protein